MPYTIDSSVVDISRHIPVMNATQLSISYSNNITSYTSYHIILFLSTLYMCVCTYELILHNSQSHLYEVSVKLCVHCILLL